MAEKRRELTRDAIQSFLKQDSGGAAPEPSGKPSKKIKKKKGKGGIGGRVTMMTRTVGNTMLEGLKAELTATDAPNRLKGFIIGAVCTVAILAGLSFVPGVGSLENIAYDFKMQLRGNIVPETGHLVHLDIDDKSLGAVGRWPWERQTWVGVISAAKAAGVRRLVFDVEFAKPQAAEPDQRAFGDFKLWKDEILKAELHENATRVRTGLDAIFGMITVAAEDLKKLRDAAKAATTQTEREQLHHTFDDQIRTMESSLADEVRNLTGELSQRDPSGKLVAEFQQRLSAIIIDHDQRLAHAIGEAGNVYLPLSFSQGRNDVVKAVRGVRWNAELAERVFKKLDEYSDINRIRTPEFAAAIQDSIDGDEAAIEEEHLERFRSLGAPAFAQDVAQRELDTFRRLYLYRLVHRWYSDKQPVLVREHMDAYLRDSQGAIRARSAPGEVFERFAGKVGDSSSQWGMAAATRLQQFYSWYLMRYGRAGQDPWTFDISCVEEYDPQAYDPWAKRKKDTGAVAGSLSHYRDIELDTPIFRLLAPAAGTGFVVIEPDNDGTLRRMPLFVVYVDTTTGERVLLPHIGFKVLLEDIHAKRETLKIIPGKYVEFLADSRIVEILKDKDAPKSRIDELSPLADGAEEWERYTVDIDDTASILVNWYGSPKIAYPEMFRHLPVATLIDAAGAADEAKANRQRLEQDVLGPGLTDLLSSPFQAQGEGDQAATDRTLGEYFFQPFAKTRAHADELKLLTAEQVTNVMSWLRQSRSEIAAGKQTVAGVLASCQLQLRKALSLPVSPDEEQKASRGEQISYSPNDIAHLCPGTRKENELLVTKFFDDLKNDLERPFGKMFQLRAYKALAALGDDGRAEFMRVMFEAADGLFQPDFDLEARSTALRELCKQKLGAYPEELSKDDPKVKGVSAAYQDKAVTQIFTAGKALRRLLFDREHTLTKAQLAAARDGKDEAAKTHTMPILRWEAGQAASAGLVDAASVPAGDTELLAWEPTLLLARLRDFREKYSRACAAIDKYEAEYRVSVDRLRPILDHSFALIGASATALGDLVSTPVHEVLPGPALHTNTYNTVVQEIVPVRMLWVSKLLALVLAAGVCVAAVRFSVKWSMAAFLGVLALYLGIDTFFYFRNQRYILETVTNLAALMAPFVAIQIFRYGVEYRAKMRIKGQFGKFLAPEVVEQLQKNPDALQLGGDEKECAVYFSDIQGFTPISESMTPPRLIEFLNRYMSRMTMAIKDSGGTVDKFIGDAVMAFWGAPLPIADFSQRACKAAIRNCQVLTDWNRERVAKGELGVGTRIGIATGPMVVGMMGTEWKLNYTCIGDTVNLAARLEGANKQYGTQIMMNDKCYTQAQSIIVAHILDNIAVKGKKKGVPVYTLLGLVGEVDPHYVEGAQVYTEAFDFYQKEKWAEALPKFQAAKKLLPPAYGTEMGPCDHMIERCERLVNATREQRMEILDLSSPDAEWDGVWHLHSK